MKLKTFFEKFDQFADAPDAVAKMRKLVRHLAVTGTLVEQDDNDEPALALLDKIAAHKAALAKEGKLRGPTTVVPMSPDEGTLGLPSSWTWVRFGEIMVNRDGERIPVSKEERATKAKTYDYYGASGVIDKIDAYLFDKPLLLIGEDGANLINRSTPIAFMARGQYWVNNHAHVLDGISEDFLRYIELHINAINLEPYVTGSAQPKMNQAKMNSIPIALPPLAEQKRIVAKVDELMALCDRLEAQQQEREEQASKLARASLARFSDAPTPANLNLLFHSSFSIHPSDLRKSILTLAVQGKLVPQDPNDEPAEELIARLEQERARIAKEQGVRPPKNVPPLIADNYPHDIPESWQWSRIGHLALVIDYGTSQKADTDPSKVPVYRMGNIVGGRLVDENLKYVDASIDDLPGLYLKTDDILFNRTNSYELVGKAGIYTGSDDTATFASYLIRIRLPSTLLLPAFYSVAMNAPYFRQTQIEPEVVQQCGQANFNGTKLASTVVPVPPLAEQRRIVAKVEQLMALVDALEQQLAASRATAANLLSALVAKLTTKD